MKILFIHQNFPGQFKLVASRLAQEGHEITALMINRAEVLKSKEGNINKIYYEVDANSTENIHPWIVDFETQLIRAKAVHLRLKRLINEKNYKPDIILGHGGWGELHLIKNLWKDVKLITYMEYFYKYEYLESIFDKKIPHNNTKNEEYIYYKNLNNIVANNTSDINLFPTNWQYENYPNEYRSKGVVVHEGVLTENFNSKNIDEIKINKENKIFTLKKGEDICIYINRNLDAIRGIHQFAEFAEKIIKINQKIKIIVVGSKDFSYSSDEISNIRKSSIDKLMKNIDQKEKNRIFFLGKIKHEELKALYKISKINIYITMPFPLSWSMLESMAASCMVVGSDTGPVKEIIQNQENGVLFEYGNISELIQNVQYYLNHENERIKIAENGARYIKENYDFEKIIFPKYKKLLGLS